MWISWWISTVASSGSPCYPVNPIGQLGLGWGEAASLLLSGSPDKAHAPLALPCPVLYHATDPHCHARSLFPLHLAPFIGGAVPVHGRC